METYEKAVSDPVASSVGRVWLEYARFAEERGKLRTAQRVYLRSLVGPPPAVKDEQDSTLLWNEFLEMMRTSNQNPSLTMTELKEAVEKEHLASQSHAPEIVGSNSSSMEDDGQPLEKRQRTESPPAPPSSSLPQLQTMKTQTVTKEAVDVETKGLLGLTTELPPEMSAAWIARDGDAPPEPPMPPLFQPSPPKLTDPTGRDLLGGELALAVIERLLESSGSILLEVCRGLWTLTALKEKEATTALDKLDKEMTVEFGQMEANLDARLSVAGAAASAIEQMNDGERAAFQQSCTHRRQQLLNYLAWEFRKVLCIQQNVLTQLKVPAFDGPTSDSQTLDLQSRICSLLHSAFYIRTKVGAKGHMAMLKSQAERLNREAKTPPRSPVPQHAMPPPIFPMYGDQNNRMMYLPPPPPPPPPQQQYGNGVPPSGYPPMMAMPPPMQMMHPMGTTHQYGVQPPQPYYQ